MGGSFGCLFLALKLVVTDLYDRAPRFSVAGFDARVRFKVAARVAFLGTVYADEIVFLGIVG